MNSRTIVDVMSCYATLESNVLEVEDGSRCRQPYTWAGGRGRGVTMTPRGGLDRGGMGAGGRRPARSGALLHECLP